MVGSGREKQTSYGRDETLAAEPIELSNRGFISSLISLSEGSASEKSGVEIVNLYLLISAVLGTCIVGMLGCFAYSRAKKFLRRKKPKTKQQGDIDPPATAAPASPPPMESKTFPDAESIERHVLNNVLGQLKYHIEHDDTMRRTNKKKLKAMGKSNKDHASQTVDATHSNNNQCVLTIPIPGWCDDDAHKQHSKIKAAEDDDSSSDESSSIGDEEQIFAVPNVADAADAVLQASSSFIQDVQNSFANDDDDGSALSWFSVGMSKKQKKAGIKPPSRGPGTFGRKLKLQRAKSTSLQMRKDSSNKESPNPEKRRKPALNHYRPSSVLRPPSHTNSRSNGNATRGDSVFGLPLPTLEASKTWERSIDTRRPKVYSMDYKAKTKKKEAKQAQTEGKKSQQSLLKRG